MGFNPNGPREGAETELAKIMTFFVLAAYNCGLLVLCSTQPDCWVGKAAFVLVCINSIMLWSRLIKKDEK